MRRGFYRSLDRAPEDCERHQVQALFGRSAPGYLREMQNFCDNYGKNSGPKGGPFALTPHTALDVVVLP